MFAVGRCNYAITIGSGTDWVNVCMLGAENCNRSIPSTELLAGHAAGPGHAPGGGQPPAAAAAAAGLYSIADIACADAGFLTGDCTSCMSP